MNPSAGARCGASLAERFCGIWSSVSASLHAQRPRVRITATQALRDGSPLVEWYAASTVGQIGLLLALKTRTGRWWRLGGRLPLLVRIVDHSESSFLFSRAVATSSIFLISNAPTAAARRKIEFVHVSLHEPRQVVREGVDLLAVGHVGS